MAPRGVRPGRITTVNVKRAAPGRGPTCLGVPSSVGEQLIGGQHGALVLVGVESELGLGSVAVLHEGHLRPRDTATTLATGWLAPC